MMISLHLLRLMSHKVSSDPQVEKATSLPGWGDLVLLKKDLLQKSSGKLESWKYIVYICSNNFQKYNLCFRFFLIFKISCFQMLYRILLMICLTFRNPLKQFDFIVRSSYILTKEALIFIILFNWPHINS